ncbi:MAG TPA: MaoC/PaaZ C-terminal domain-containing protein [Polyangia bacterium]
MSVSLKFIRYQGPVLRGMGEAAVGALKQRLGGKPNKGNGQAHAAPTLPGPEHHLTVSPRPAELVNAYVRWVGGDPASYKGRVPAHLFPQWGFPLTGKMMDGLSYPMLAAMNGGCKLTINGALPAGEPLEVSGRLDAVDDNGQRAILDQKIVTGTKANPEAVVAHLYVFVPLKKEDKKSGKNGAGGKAKDKARVPVDAREIAFFKLRDDAGLDFAKLTGDFNPVHWVPRWAKAFGFRNVILHGFGTLARAIEALNRGLFAGDVDALAEIDVRFTRPLVLPARVGVYVRGDKVWVGDAPGGPAYLEGSFKLRNKGQA